MGWDGMERDEGWDQEVVVLLSTLYSHIRPRKLDEFQLPC